MGREKNQHLQSSASVSARGAACVHIKALRGVYSSLRASASVNSKKKSKESCTVKHRVGVIRKR